MMNIDEHTKPACLLFLEGPHIDSSSNPHSAEVYQLRF
jgi:hypothetical protein